MSKLLQLVETATELAHSRGLHATSMALIAKRSHIAMGTIYQLYPSKDALYTDLLSSYYQKLTELIKDLDQETEFDPLLRHCYQIILGTLKSDMPAFGLFLQLRQLSPYAAAAKAHQDEFETKLARLMEVGKRKLLLKNLSSRCLGVMFFEHICGQVSFEDRHPHDLSLQSKDLLEEAAISGLLK